jgi:NADPH:quinone reductase-like Zn-dependent oxidoreductase
MGRSIGADQVIDYTKEDFTQADQAYDVMLDLVGTRSFSPFVPQRMRVFVVRHNTQDLVVLKQLAETGKIAPVIDRRYSLSDVPEALRYQGEGRSQGKIVIAASEAP